MKGSQKGSGLFYVKVIGWLSRGSEFPYWVIEGRGGEEIGVTPWMASTKLYLYSEHSIEYSLV